MWFVRLLKFLLGVDGGDDKSKKYQSVEQRTTQNIKNIILEK